MSISGTSFLKSLGNVFGSTKAAAGAESVAKTTSAKALPSADKVERSAAGVSEKIYGSGVAKDPLHAEHNLLLDNNTVLGIVHKHPDALRNFNLIKKIEERYGTETAAATLKYAIEQAQKTGRPSALG